MDAPRSLIDILACPGCRGPLERRDRDLRCAACGSAFPLLEGVPLLMPGGRLEETTHEGVLAEWRGYFPLMQQLVDALPASHVVLDLGAGNRNVDDPRIVRLDVFRTPFVDVIGDALQLPFRDGTIDFVYASAVFEHLRDPFEAAREIGRVLKPGGHVLADCNFVYPFHGYPAVYFNASANGLEQIFRELRVLQTLVAPWQMPSYSLEALVAQYLRFFRAETDQERGFADVLMSLDTFPVRAFDARFSQEQAKRIAAGTTILAMKDAGARNAVIPGALLAVHARDPELRARYPSPETFVESIVGSGGDSFLLWAASEGRRLHPEISRCYSDALPFSRQLGTG